MKIALRVTIEMAPEQVEAYCAAVGVDRGELREDIASYVRTAIKAAPDFTIAGVDVSLYRS